MVKQNVPIYLSVPKYINGLNVKVKDVEDLFITPGKCRDSTGTNDMELLAPVFVNSVVKGAGGLDFGVIEANKMYRVHLIGSSTNQKPVSAVYSLRDIPVLPPEYDMFRRIGYVTTRQSLVPPFAIYFVPQYQYGVGLNKTYYYQESIIVSGAQDVSSLLDWPIAEGVGSYVGQPAVPPTAKHAIVNVEYNGQRGSRFLPATPFYPPTESSGSVLFIHGNTVQDANESDYTFRLPIQSKNGVANVTFLPQSFTPLINGKFSYLKIVGYIDRLAD